MATGEMSENWRPKELGLFSFSSVREGERKWARFFSVVHSDRPSGNNSIKIKHRRGLLNIRKHFSDCRNDWALAQVAHVGYRIYGIQESSGYGCGQPSKGELGQGHCKLHTGINSQITVKLMRVNDRTKSFMFISWQLQTLRMVWTLYSRKAD